jgi:restriction system protein
MMARRRRQNKEDLITVLLALPWQVSVALSAVAFIMMKWIVPSSFHSPALASLALAASYYSGWVAVGLLVIAAISFAKNKKPMADFSSRQIRSSNQSSQSRTVSPSMSAPEKIYRPRPTKWSIELLRTIEWNRFEILAAEYFRTLGKRVETISHGADGGVDARIYANDSSTLEYAIQCKAWNSAVGIKPIRVRISEHRDRSFR